MYTCLTILNKYVDFDLKTNNPVYLWKIQTQLDIEQLLWKEWRQGWMPSVIKCRLYEVFLDDWTLIKSIEFNGFKNTFAHIWLTE